MSLSKSAVRLDDVSSSFGSQLGHVALCYSINEAIMCQIYSPSSFSVPSEASCVKSRQKLAPAGDQAG